MTIIKFNKSEKIKTILEECRNCDIQTNHYLVETYGDNLSSSEEFECEFCDHRGVIIYT